MLESITEAMPWLCLICIVLSLIGCAYAVAAGWAVLHFAHRAVHADPAPRSVTILKPVSGFELNLYENLASFCQQSYRGPVQIIFGAQSAADTAVAVVRQLIVDFPQVMTTLVIDPRPHGSNRKIANLINMAPYIAHDIVLVADSDIRVETDHLQKVLGALEQPGIGLVTCLYRGQSVGNVWSGLGCMAIDFHFLPSVLIGLALGLARPCFGSTIALERDTLLKIGGFAAFADRLADDYAIGAAVRRLGYGIAIPPFLVAHTCSEQRFAQLLRHELRWARTIRSVDGWGFIGSGVTHALPFALIAAALRGFDPLGWELLAVALACRLCLYQIVTRAFRLSGLPQWLSPLRDGLSFLVYLGCFMTSRIDWRGQDFRLEADGTLTPSARNQSNP
jgi:ceramide glucosyltransferase